jgi:hypothetical protein
MQRVAAGQLSFDAGKRAGKRQVDTASLKLSGAFPARALVDDEHRWPQLAHGEQVVVRVIELGSGELIAQGIGAVKVGFDDKTLDGEPYTIRVHTIKMGDGDIPSQQGVREAAQALKDTLDEHNLTMSVETNGKSATVRGSKAKS